MGKANGPLSQTEAGRRQLIGNCHLTEGEGLTAPSAALLFLLLPSFPSSPILPPCWQVLTASAMGTIWAQVTHLTGKSLFNRKEIGISLITASLTLLGSGPKAMAQ